MKRIIVCLTVTLLTFAVGVAVALNLQLLKRSNETNLNVASGLPSQRSSIPPTYQADVLKLVRAPNEPVSILEIRFANSGDLLIDIENISPKPMIFAGYVLAPFDRCPKTDHPMAVWIGYGDWSVISGNGIHKIDAPIDPAHKVTLTVSRKVYDEILNSQKLAKCISSAKPELYLDKVAFNDGSGWQGFADGVDHSEWNGRPWIPERKK